jgi:hypothetical protein
MVRRTLCSVRARGNSVLDGPPGGAQAPAMPPFQCQQCGAPVPFDEPIPRDSECESCGRDLRCCMNCRHYDPSRNNSCRETEADLVEDKARRNFCEYFSFNRAALVAGKRRSPREAEARAQLEGLFGGRAPVPGSSSEARRKLEDLFKKKPPADEGD